MGARKKKKTNRKYSINLRPWNIDWVKNCSIFSKPNGLKYNSILIPSSILLIIMMLVAVYVRIKIKDNISDILPAIAYLVLGIIILRGFS